MEMINKIVKVTTVKPSFKEVYTFFEKDEKKDKYALKHEVFNHEDTHCGFSETKEMSSYEISKVMVMLIDYDTIEKNGDLSVMEIKLMQDFIIHCKIPVTFEYKKIILVDLLDLIKIDDNLENFNLSDELNQRQIENEYISDNIISTLDDIFRKPLSIKIGM